MSLASFEHDLELPENFMKSYMRDISTRVLCRNIDRAEMVIQAINLCKAKILRVRDSQDCAMQYILEAMNYTRREVDELVYVGLIATCILLKDGQIVIQDEGIRRDAIDLREELKTDSLEQSDIPRLIKIFNAIDRQEI